MLCLWLIQQAAFSVNHFFRFETYDTRSGLSHNEVLAIHEDKQGFIWVGTEYGLNRFDGWHFEVFLPDSQEPNPQTDQIIEDAEGWLWMVTYRIRWSGFKVERISFIHSRTLERMTFAERMGNEVSIDEKDIWRVSPDGKGGVMMGTEDGRLIKWNSKQGAKVQFITDGDSLVPWHVSSRNTILASKGFWQGRSDYLEIGPDGKVIQRIPHANFRIMGENSQGEIIACKSVRGTWKDSPFYRFKSGNAPQNIPLKGPGMEGRCFTNARDLELFYDPVKDEVWYKGNGQVFLLSLEEGLIVNLYRAPMSGKIADKYANAFFLDHLGNIWIGSPLGLVLARVEKNKYSWLLRKPRADGQVPSCFTLVPDGKELVVATKHHGIWRVNPETREETLWLPKGVQQKYPSLGTLGMIHDKDKWYFVSRKELVAHEPKTDSWRSIYPQSSAYKRLVGLHEDARGKIWLGSMKGELYSWNKKSDSLSLFSQWNGHYPKNPDVITSFQNDGDQGIWFSSYSGLYYLDFQKGITGRYWTGGEGKYKLPNHTINYLGKDHENILWLGMQGGGIQRLDPKASPGKHVRSIRHAAGFPSGAVRGIYEYPEGTLWIISKEAIIRMTTSDFKLRVWDSSEGLPIPRTNGFSNCLFPDGGLAMGGGTGIAYVRTDDLNETPTSSAPLKITRFQQLDAESQQFEDRTLALDSLGEIRIIPGEELMIIDFSLLDYFRQKFIRYFYKVEGQDPQWNEVQEPRIRLSGLDYGNYTLKVKAQLKGEATQGGELAVPITVVRPFYRQIWFYVAIIALALALILYGFQRRTRNLRRRRDELEQKVKERTHTIEVQAEELKQLDKVKSRFFANVSHELRTPLTLILGPLKTVHSSPLVSGENKKMLKLAVSNSQKLLEMVNEILDLTKLEAGKMELRESVVRINPVMRRWAGSFESLAQDQQLQFIVELETDDYLHLRLDLGKLEKIVLNLLSNAFKFTPSQGSVTLKVKDPGNVIRVSVQDNGRGIHADDLPHVFDRYYQTKRKETAAQGGTGIGLALCQEFARVMEAKLWVESEWEKGSTFHFEFPKTEVMGTWEDETEAASEAAAAESQTTVLPPPPEKESHKEQVLLVEDNPELREYIQLILQEKYQVTATRNGLEAWNLLEKDKIRFQLIISDIMMPEMDGFQLLEKLKSDLKLAQIPVIMLTARASLRAKLKALRIGVDDYMLKPFEKEELIARTENLLGYSRTRRAERAQPEEAQITSTPKKSTAPTLGKEDQEWLEKLEDKVKTGLTRFDFNVGFLADEMSTSRQTLFRRLKQLTGLSPIKYLQEARLTQARELLEEEMVFSVKAASLEVGIKDTKYFSSQFKARFGKSPSEYLR